MSLEAGLFYALLLLVIGATGLTLFALKLRQRAHMHSMSRRRTPRR